VKRSVRRNIDIALTGLGVGIIFSAVILGSSLDIRAQLPIALIGVLIMEAGVWGLAAKLFPSERRFLKLREEGDRMIDLIRELNAAAIAKDTGAEDAKRFQETLQEMHDSVLKMSELAAIEDNSKSRKSGSTG